MAILANEWFASRNDQRAGRDELLFPRVSNRDLAIKWTVALLVSACLAAINPGTEILAGILMAIILGLVVDAVLFLRVRATTRRLKGYAAVLSRVAANPRSTAS
jgi:hypothetical protein